MTTERRQAFKKSDAGLVFQAAAAQKDRADWLKEVTAEHAPGEINPWVAVEKRPKSRPAAIRAECWSCAGGDGDGGATGKIKACAMTGCALWLLRPYQDQTDRKAERGTAKERAASTETEAGKVLDPVARLQTMPWSNALAVRAYCWQCQGAGKNQNSRRDVAECSVIKCGLWDIRPWKTGKDAESSDAPQY